MIVLLFLLQEVIVSGSNVEGRIPCLPEGSVVTLRVWRCIDSARWQDVRIQSERVEAAPPVRAKVYGGKFRESVALPAAGSYVVHVEFTKEAQISSRIVKDFDSGKLQPVLVAHEFQLHDFAELQKNVKSAVPKLVRIQTELQDLRDRLSTPGADFLSVSLRCNTIRDDLAEKLCASPLPASCKALESLAESIQHRADLKMGPDQEGAPQGIHEGSKDLIKKEQPKDPDAPKQSQPAAKEEYVDKITRLASRETALILATRAKSLVRQTARVEWARSELLQMARVGTEFKMEELFTLALEGLDGKEESLKKFDKLVRQLETSLREQP